MKSKRNTGDENMIQEKTIRVCIVDDEPIACRRIQRLLKDDSSIEILKICSNGEQAADAIKKLSPDLIFLDIQMPGMNGFEMLKSVPVENMPHVIFVTAYDRYAIQAFEVHALDYLLKPFDTERFEEALTRAKSQIDRDRSRNLNKGLYALLEEMKTPPRYLERLVIKASGRVFFLKTDEIDWIEAQGKYVSIHSGKDEHLVREGMNTLENELDPRKFVRIHKSTIVNIDRIEQLQAWFHGDYRVILKNGTMLTLSRRYRQKLDELLGKPL
ncbi:LytTR family DNA-binding domain-containing protein [bacterium]|nr:LytTR family DNA-binding domain-containing protein [bacterium]MCI0615434.1 LytTR family DNA-binding domain-containing protein [bacterium]